MLAALRFGAAAAVARTTMPRSPLLASPIRPATKKVGKGSKNNRESAGRRLGVKRFGSELVGPGEIVVRQRGTAVRPGDGCGMGRDHTLFARRGGFVKFTYDVHTKRQVVSIEDSTP
eukprot:TRINITY_DN8_c4_g1_i1.p2 TRINITY_DN8_c4_g1~~TRINITY_DN8_c4_g1_i1.p2  ORF type:complete len:126 (+),score=32.57 TRINITY_DN8_c4_g1_i1:28-378(+)